jgi:hypothetical protein
VELQLPIGTSGPWETCHGVRAAVWKWTPAQCFDSGANIVTWHQGLDANPFINWPFSEQAQAMYLDNFVKGAHATSAERKVLVYFTTRELSNHASELFAFRAHEHAQGFLGHS